LPPEPGARRAGRVPTIFAMGGGGFTMEPGNPALDDYVRTLAPAREPRICLLPTAGGDSEDQIRRFHATFDDQLCEPTHISLFRLGSQPVPLR
jgi:dipeptidase E